ncbi:MAG: type II secretion system protein [Candidatus Omnitrophica bacterium]|nr:type II secretion system protein [Candidatus Omnitrophota bacterium]
MRRGFTLVEVIIVAAIIALLVGIALPNWLKMRIKTNENNAQEILKKISEACDHYAAANNGDYPRQIAHLTDATASYLDEDYTALSRQGYNFSCDEMSISGYTCTAAPVTCQTTGSKTFMIITGGVLTQAPCGGET